MTNSNLEPFEIEMAALSDAGTERGHNEDHCGKYVKSKTCGLVAVADGMATMEGGELASQRAILALMRSFRELAPGLTQTQRLVRAARSANYEVYDMAVIVPQLRGMSTTLTAVSVTDGELTAAHVGNSRVYLLRDGYINQLSKDHTVAAEAAEATGNYVLKGSDVLTRSLGRELLVPIDLFELDLVKGDVVVLCTDGLIRVFEDLEIAEMVKNLDAATACRKLIDQANAIGTLDNVTAAVVRVIGETPGTRR
ncbi:MAG TPA: protein phosphatase 2C domain-containing protein [Polyangia bacterium]